MGEAAAVDRAMCRVDALGLIGLCLGFGFSASLSALAIMSAVLAWIGGTAAAALGLIAAAALGFTAAAAGCAAALG